MIVENNQEKSTHGGARPGAGRKPGSLTAKTRAIAEKCAEQGATPLEVMVEAYLKLKEEGNIVEAAKIAKDAAPYMHPRLSNIELSGDADSPVQLSIGWQK
jgi:hypothetical protein